MWQILPMSGVTRRRSNPDTRLPESQTGRYKALFGSIAYVLYALSIFLFHTMGHSYIAQMRIVSNENSISSVRQSKIAKYTKTTRPGVYIWDPIYVCRGTSV